MPTAVENSIIAVLKPFADGPDISHTIRGLQPPDTVDVQHQHTSEAVTINFTLTDNTFSQLIGLLVPAVQHQPEVPTTDFIHTVHQPDFLV